MVLSLLTLLLVVIVVTAGSIIAVRVTMRLHFLRTNKASHPDHSHVVWNERNTTSSSSSNPPSNHPTPTINPCTGSSHPDDEEEVAEIMRMLPSTTPRQTQGPSSLSSSSSSSLRPIFRRHARKNTTDDTIMKEDRGSNNGVGVTENGSGRIESTTGTSNTTTTRTTTTTELPPSVIASTEQSTFPRLRKSYGSSRGGRWGYSLETPQQSSVITATTSRNNHQVSQEQDMDDQTYLLGQVPRKSDKTLPRNHVPPGAIRGYTETRTSPPLTLPLDGSSSRQRIVSTDSLSLSSMGHSDETMTTMSMTVEEHDKSVSSSLSLTHHETIPAPSTVWMVHSAGMLC